MPRQRIVKPDFWSSPQIARLSHSARCCFIGLWNFCDDGGRHRASVARLRIEVFPADQLTDDDVAGFIDELKASHGQDGVPLVKEYEVAGVWYWQVTGWKHQYIQHPFYLHPDTSGVVPGYHNVPRTLSERSNQLTERNGIERNEKKYDDDDDGRTETKRKSGFSSTGGPSGGLDNGPDGGPGCDPGGGQVTNHRRVDWESVSRDQLLPAAKVLLPEGGRLAATMQEVLLRAGYLAAAHFSTDWLLCACKITRYEKPKKPPNFLKGVLEKSSGVPKERFYSLYDSVKPPAPLLAVKVVLKPPQQPWQSSESEGDRQPYKPLGPAFKAELKEDP